MERLDVDGATIEYQMQGAGEPVLLLHSSGVADGLARPLSDQPELASRYRLIHYHRRGYGGSTPGTQPLTVARQAADAVALLQHLQVHSAHVAGHSYGGVIALQLALDAPELVGSLALLEPPLPMLPSGSAGLSRVLGPVMNAYASGDKRAAVDLFGNATFGPDWQPIVERTVPGAVEQAVQDIDAAVRELPAIQTWTFGPEQTAAIRRPVLSVLGVRTSPFMQAGRTLLHSWFPQTEDSTLPTTHLLQIQDPQGAAHGLAEFFGRHPMT